jgi:hypothetical protein
LAARRRRKPLVLVSASGKSKRMPLARIWPIRFSARACGNFRRRPLPHRIRNEENPRLQDRRFRFPALTRADASLHFPAYTSLTNQIIPDTFRVSAVEGTRLTYTLQLNKPVTRARFIGKRKRWR